MSAEIVADLVGAPEPPSPARCGATRSGRHPAGNGPNWLFGRDRSLLVAARINVLMISSLLPTLTRVVWSGTSVWPLRITSGTTAPVGIGNSLM